MLVTDLFNQNQLSPHLSKQALFDLGVARQQDVPSRELAAYVPVDRNPLDLIAATESQMLPDLLALRHQRMGVSPFTFFRGTAELMEHDLAEQSHSGIQVIISGDAHVNNYGFYASPERKLLFGLNDFDEARIGNWEDDLKRLLVSTYLAGQSNGFSERDLLPILTNVTRTYRYGVKYANALTLPERFYFSYEIHDMMATIDRISDDQPHKISTILEKILKKSPQKNSEQVIAKLTTADEEGRRYFIEQAPRAKRVPQAIKDQLIRGYHRYLKNTREDVRIYLTNFTVDDVIRYAVGVGSFGTHCYLMLLSGNDGSHLVLQIKEALPLRASLTSLSSDRDLRLAQERSAGRRIVTAQKTLQSASDPFLGASHFGHRSYYFRQFRDMKESIDVAKLDLESFGIYTATCAFLLAIAHFQSPTAPMIAGYLHHQKPVDDTLADWAVQYAGQVNRDYQIFINY